MSKSENCYQLQPKVSCPQLNKRMRQVKSWRDWSFCLNLKTSDSQKRKLHKSLTKEHVWNLRAQSRVVWIVWRITCLKLGQSLATTRPEINWSDRTTQANFLLGCKTVLYPVVWYIGKSKSLKKSTSQIQAQLCTSMSSFGAISTGSGAWIMEIKSFPLTVFITESTISGKQTWRLSIVGEQVKLVCL